MRTCNCYYVMIKNEGEGEEFVAKLDYDELLAKYNFMVDSAQQNAKERDAWKEAHDRKQILVSKMDAALMEKGVNFDFQKALDDSNRKSGE